MASSSVSHRKIMYIPADAPPPPYGPVPQHQPIRAPRHNLHITRACLGGDLVFEAASEESVAAPGSGTMIERFDVVDSQEAFSVSLTVDKHDVPHQANSLWSLASLFALCATVILLKLHAFSFLL
ncbi:hypothetical protein AURDEDRAFT_175709 [Auricularia subglabra TFB-10046 SS5]|nr:hypothetical protein AURDEDRAFT_175709 [Auricularia subglabra TFB-10046 SS5]